MVKSIKPIIYIFCEWATEEKYFIQLSRILNNKSFRVKTFDLEWWTRIMHHPEQIKRFIQSKLRHEKVVWLVQKVFVVFDLDIFTDKSKLQNTLNVLNGFEVIVSNEDFEYWILSHFEKYDLWKWNKNIISVYNDIGVEKFAFIRDKPTVSQDDPKNTFVTKAFLSEEKAVDWMKS